MASNSKVKYGSGAVYGSLAYDFDNPELYPEIYSSPLERTAPPQTREDTAAGVRTGARTHARTRQGISPAAVLGMMVAAVLFVIALLAQIQLVGISDTSVQLQSQLSQLETEQAKLQIAYESAFNLTEIEEYATTQLGMQKPNADQIYYIDTASMDKAVVVETSSSDSFVDQVSDFFSGIFEYFR